MNKQQNRSEAIHEAFNPTKQNKMDKLAEQYTVETFAPDKGRADGISTGRTTCHHTNADKEAADSAYLDAQAAGYLGTATAVVRNHLGRFVCAYVAQQQEQGVALERCDTLEAYNATCEHFMGNTDRALVRQ